MAPRELPDRSDEDDGDHDIGACAVEDFSLFGSDTMTMMVVDDDAELDVVPTPCDKEQELVRFRAHTRRLLALKRPSLVSDTNNSKHDDKKDLILRNLMECVSNTCGAHMDDVEPRKDAHGGRGLFATRDIARPGHVMAVLPRNLRLGQRHAIHELPGLSSQTPDLTATSLLVLQWYAASLQELNKENCLDEEKKDDIEHDNNHKMGLDPSFGVLYAQSLPMLPSECNNAVLMSEEDVQAWSNRPEYYQEMLKVRAQADCCVQYIRQVFLQDDDDNTDTLIPRDSAIYWAIAMVLSRTHAFGSHQGGRWMTPVLDLANHSLEANAYLEGDSQGRLLLKAHRPIGLGEEITLDYQVPQDHQLVATYGFSLLGITVDCESN